MFKIKNRVCFVILSITAVLYGCGLDMDLEPDQNSLVESIYTAPQEIDVPDVKGMEFYEAKRLFNGLTLQSETEPSDEIPAGHVIRTEPESGSTVPYKSTVIAVISSGSGETTVPDLTGVPYAEAKVKLDTLKLRIKQEEAPSSEVPRGSVIEQTPGPGAPIDPDGLVIITVSTGVKAGGHSVSEGKVVVPDITGMTLSQAKAVITASELKLDKPDSKGEVVISQDPVSGNVVDKKEKITVTLGDAPKEEKKEEKKEEAPKTKPKVIDNALAEVKEDEEEAEETEEIREEESFRPETADKFKKNKKDITYTVTAPTNYKLNTSARILVKGTKTGKIYCQEKSSSFPVDIVIPSGTVSRDTEAVVTIIYTDYRTESQASNSSQKFRLSNQPSQ